MNLCDEMGDETADETALHTSSYTGNAKPRSPRRSRRAAGFPSVPNWASGGRWRRAAACGLARAAARGALLAPGPLAPSDQQGREAREC